MRLLVMGATKRRRSVKAWPSGAFTTFGAKVSELCGERWKRVNWRGYVWTNQRHNNAGRRMLSRVMRVRREGVLHLNKPAPGTKEYRRMREWA